MANVKGSNIWKLSNTCYVNLNIGKVYCLQGEELKEFSFGRAVFAPRILELFLKEQGNKLTYDEIIRYAWGNKGKNPNKEAFDHDVNVHVGKLAAMGELGQYIKSIRTEGYVFSCPELLEIDQMPMLSKVSPISYFEALWNCHYRGIVRDQRATGNIRELIDFYVPPDILATNGKQLQAPFSNLNSHLYITAGSGLGKTALLQMTLLVSIVDSLIAQNSKVISENTIAKISEYQAIRNSLFGDLSHQCFPVFIRSASANNTHFNSVLDIADAHNVDHFKEMVNNAHKAGTLLFLIDSIDEVEHGDKIDTFIKGVDALLKEYPGAEAILTSRFLGKKQLPFEYKTVHIAELNDTAIQKVVQGMLSHRSAVELLETLDDFKNNAHLATLARNPFMLLTIIETKKDRHLHQVLESIVHAIIERRWDTTSYDISEEDIKMLLGHLACKFVFGNLSSASFVDVREAFIKAQKSLQQNGYEVDISNENMDRFLHMLSCQSGILNLTYVHHVERYLFQDNLVMCWLAAYYVSRIITSPNNTDIEYRGDEANLWSNAMWINKFILSFMRKQCILSADAINTLVIALVLCGDLGGRELQQSILYYMLFKNVTSTNEKEKSNILEGYQSLLCNTFGATHITNQSSDDCYKMISTAIGNLRNS